MIIGFETSCDESGIALADMDGAICENMLYSQIDIHKKYGGVVPEIASRHHVTKLFELMDAIKTRRPDFLSEIKAVAVTVRPGLVGALLIGLEAAKTLAFQLNVPLIPIDHLKAHLFGACIEADLEFPFMGLIVSGGHTILCMVHDFDHIDILGQTRDDAVGEAYDKVSKLLEMGYPGGPVIDRIYGEYEGKYEPFPQPMKHKGLEFSFSGLKTAVLRYVDQAGGVQNVDKEYVAASFQHTVMEIIFHKLKKALKLHPVKQIAVVGGVSANAGLRKRLEKLPAQAVFPAMQYCTDNAAMIAGLGSWYYQQKRHLYSPDSDDFYSMNAVPFSEI